jgi:hypothetical protein
MRTVLLASLLATAATLSAQTAGPVNPHAPMQMRGEQAMGFDLEKTTHHFYLYPDGGAIDISVKDPADKTNREAIRTHLPHIAMMFGAGDFSTPHFIHGGDVPGAADMTRLKDRLAFKYVATPAGGRVDVATRDAAALKALHAFLRYQITEHKTGDPLDVGKPRR